MSEKQIKKIILPKIENLNKDQIVFFARLCSIRALPFIGLNGNFNFWGPPDTIHLHLYAIINAIDIAASYPAMINFNVVRAATDASIAAVKTAAATRAADAAVKTVAAIRAIDAAAKTAATRTTDASASAAAYAIVAADNHVNLYPIILDDISCVKKGKYDKFKNETGLYGDIWNNFQKALNDVDCGYWGRLYEKIFNSGFQFDQKELRLRLDVPRNIKGEGAKAVADYLKKNESAKILRESLNDCMDCIADLMAIQKLKPAVIEELTDILHDLKEAEKLTPEEIKKERLLDKLENFIKNLSDKSLKIYKAINGEVNDNETVTKLEKTYKYIVLLVSLPPVLESKNGLLQIPIPKQTISTVFLSYCSKESDLADIIDNYFSRVAYVLVSRYTKDVGYRDSFKEFMKKVKKHDFVIMLVSDNFLKSQPCMFEVGELLEDDDFKKKLLFIIVSDGDSIYLESAPSNRIGAKIHSPLDSIGYIKYWEEEYAKLKKSLDTIKSDSAKIEPSKQLREIESIIDHDLGPFLEYLSDARGKSFSELYKSKFDDFLSIIARYQ